jgi:hypothetical protein
MLLFFEKFNGASRGQKSEIRRREEGVGARGQGSTMANN